VQSIAETHDTSGSPISLWIPLENEGVQDTPFQLAANPPFSAIPCGADP
jgi:hypothetical protein